MPERLRLPAGETSISFDLRSTGPDYATDGDAEVLIKLAYPPGGECLPYRIADTESLARVVDTSQAIPEDCSAKVNFEVSRQRFKMDEGDTVSYQVYLSGPTPTSFPVIIKWQIINPDGYTVFSHNPAVPDGHEHKFEAVYTASDWGLRRGRPLSLTISDPNDKVDGDGKVMVAHHLVFGGSFDPNYSSVHCLQGPTAWEKTQMLVRVTDVPVTDVPPAGQQPGGGDGGAGDIGVLRRPDPEGEPQPQLAGAKGDGSEPQPEPEPETDRQPEPEQQPEEQPDTQQGTDPNPEPEPEPEPQPEPEPEQEQQPEPESQPEEQPESDQASEDGQQPSDTPDTTTSTDPETQPTDSEPADIVARYDTDNDGKISLSEYSAAAQDFAATKITLQQVLAVKEAYLAGYR